MPKTNVEAILNLKGNNDKIQSDSTYSTSNNQNFANIENLGNKLISFPKLMTLEHNINVLNGTIQHIQKNKTYGISYCGSNISDRALKVNNSEINITLKHIIDTDIEGITFYFGDTISVGELTVKFISSDNKSILTKLFEPKSNIYKMQVSVSKFKYIKIIFNKTKFPQVYPKLQLIEFGINYYFTNENIISCVIDEEVYPISNILPINTCDITLYSKENEFNPFVHDSMFYALSPNSLINIYGIYNDNRFIMGKFYLDTWDSTKNYELTLHCISILGKLDKIKFYNGGLIGYNNKPTVDNSIKILKDIFNDLGYKENSNYTIQPDITAVPLSGELPVKTYREAIQLVAFTAGYYIDDTRDGIIKIGETTHTNDLYIDKSITFEPIKITENEDITKINVDINNIDYRSLSEFSTVFKGDLLANETKVIITNNPIISAQYRKGTGEWINIYLQYIGTYKISIKADSLGGEYAVQTQYFNSEKYTISESMKSDRQIKDNEISITNNTLLYSYSESGGEENITAFIKRIKDYYSYNKYKVEFDFINNGTFRTGKTVSIYTQYNQLMIGTILKQHINLSGGFISTVTMIANNKDLNYDYYATTGNYELICGDIDKSTSGSNKAGNILI